MTIRDHNPIVIENFNGLFRRGDADSCPADHFPDCNNIQFIQSGFETRDGIDTALGNNLGLGNILRMYTFVQETGQSLIILTDDGNFWDVKQITNVWTVQGPILSIPNCNDFGFVSMNGRAYISPANDAFQGMANEFVYVYQGDGTAARKAAGKAPIDSEGLLAAANSATTGNVEAGYHIFGVVYETDTGFLTSIGPVTLSALLVPGNKKVDLSAIPVSLNSYVKKVHIVATRAIPAAFYNGNTRGYDFFQVPGAIVNNGVTTLTVNFFDSELLQDATFLQDLYEEIPAGVGLSSYHNRLQCYATHSDISLDLVSFPGEPEAISQIDGLIVFPLDGDPITIAQEFRDVNYIFKQTKTNAWTDNGDVPSAWPMTLLDQGIGAAPRGIATVLGSGGTNVDYLQIADYSGIFLFDGAYRRPELTWKIFDFWKAVNKFFFRRIQIVNDSYKQQLFITLPDRQMLMADYSNGLDPKNVRWAPWTFDVQINSIALMQTDQEISQLMLGSASPTV